MEIVNFIIPAVSTGAVAGLLAAGYTKAPPDMAYIISGVFPKP